MYKVKCLEDFGQWFRKGKEVEINNKLAEKMEAKGYVKILCSLGKRNVETSKSLQIRILKLEADIKALQVRKREYEKIRSFLVAEEKKQVKGVK